MVKLKLKIAKSKRINPAKRTMGYAARVITNGKADFNDIVEDAGNNTTMHMAEVRMAFELCMSSITKMLRQGYIVDLGPLGKIYPSCQSGWFEHEEDMTMASVKPRLYFRPADDLASAVRSASLTWVKAADDLVDDTATD